MRRAATLCCALLGVALLGCGLAGASSNGLGDVVVTLHGGIRPRLLPRATPAPVAIRVAGDVKSASGRAQTLPQLVRITVGINREGKLFDRGLPVCRARWIQPATERGAREVCGGAIVGKGRVGVEVRIPGQPPFTVNARLLAFNGPRRHGRKLIIAQAYAKEPPGAFILTFTLVRRPGTYGTVLTTTLPPGTRKWAYLTHFDMTLHRVYTYGGRRRSYISAACAAPDGFAGTLFPFARATYSFVDGTRLSVSETGTCRVAE